MMMVRKLNVKHETTQVLKDSMDKISLKTQHKKDVANYRFKIPKK